MPLHYPDGILAEHLHTRRSAGLFDVSHIGQIAVFADSGDESTGGKSTDDESTAAALESLMPVDILSLPGGRQKYGLLTNSGGGIIDDLMIQNLGDRFVLVVNAACKQRDFDHLRRHLGTAQRLEFPKTWRCWRCRGRPRRRCWRAWGTISPICVLWMCANWI